VNGVVTPTNVSGVYFSILQSITDSRLVYTAKITMIFNLLMIHYVFCCIVFKLKRHYGCIRSAPSKRITSPFSIGFSTMHCTRCANSSGKPSRGGNGTVLDRNCRTLSGSVPSSGVSIKPTTSVFHIKVTRNPSSRMMCSPTLAAVVQLTHL